MFKKKANLYQDTAKTKKAGCPIIMIKTMLMIKVIRQKNDDEPANEYNEHKL